MSLLKSIYYGKEKRKPHYGSKTFDYSCKNHGSCPACLSNRKYQETKVKDDSKEQLNEFKKGNSKW